MTINMYLHSVCLAKHFKCRRSLVYCSRGPSMVGFLGVLLHYDNVAEFSVTSWMQSFLLSGDSSGPGFQSFCSGQGTGRIKLHTMHRIKHNVTKPVMFVIYSWVVEYAVWGQVMVDTNALASVNETKLLAFGIAAAKWNRSEEQSTL